MADDQDAIWGICGGLLPKSVEGTILLWIFSMLCPTTGNETSEGDGQDALVIANPLRTSLFFNNF